MTRPTPEAIARVASQTGPFLSPETSSGFQAFLKADNSWPEIRISSARSGDPTLGIAAGPAPEFRLCSAHDPAGEAERQVGQWASTQLQRPDGLIILSGVTGPWHLRALARRLEPGGTILVLEPHPELLAAQIAAFPDDFFAGLAPSHLEIAAASDPDRLLDTLCRRLSESFLPAWAEWTPPAALRYDREGFLHLARRIHRAIEQEAFNRNTTGMFAALWYRNAVSNLPALLRESPLNPLIDAFPGEQALVIAAGPSLDRVLPRLQRLAASSLVIAVSTALPCLQRHGIRPHLVIAVDSDPIIVRQLEAGRGDDHWFMAAPPTIDPGVFELCRDRCLIFNVDLLPGFTLWLHQQDLLPASLRIGGTVAVSAVDLAVRTGCRRLFLAGLDLSFGDSDATHAEGAVYGHLCRMPAGLIQVPGNFTPTVRTTRQFASYINILTGYFARTTAEHPELQVCNISDGGARLGDVQALTPENIPESAIRPVHFDFHEYILSARTNVRSGRDMRSVSSSFHEAGSQFRDIAVLAAEAETILRTAPGGAPSSHDLERINRIDAALRSHDTAMTLIDLLFRTLCRGTAAAAPDAVMAAQENLYRNLSQAASWSAVQFEEVASSLS